jgi:peptidoglycan hydrolase FlgJ
MTTGIPTDVLLSSASGSGAADGANDKDRQRTLGAAKDFEALLIGQMLRSVREEDSGWLGTGDDDAGSAAFSLGEDQLAKAMAASGGLGLSRVIAAGLATRAGTGSRP